MLVVVDYGLGNLRSICAALDYLKVDYDCTADRSIISKADGLILPGVGAFGDGMRRLNDLGLVELLDELVIQNKIPILGICLGFQIMAREGMEFGITPGLGWISGVVTKLNPSDSALRVPHVGWNDCFRVSDSVIFSDISDEALFYFVHSYQMRCEDPTDVVAQSDHGGRFVAAVQKENIFGTQFHPEKSQSQGLNLLKNFTEKVVGQCCEKG